MRKIAKSLLERAGYQLSIKPEKQYEGVYTKFKDFTMIPKPLYCDNLRLSAQFKKIEGDIVECGVWRGGMIAGIASILGNRKHFYLFDSFEGLPQAKEIDGQTAMEWQKNTTSEFYFDNCKVEMSWAEKAMSQTNVQFTMVKGYFNETLPGFKFDNPISILRLDGDWYDSTLCCLNALFPKVSIGGLIIIDDYYAWDGCAKAVHDYLSRNSLASKIHQTPRGLAYIIKKD